VIISAKTEYACIAVLTLATRYGSGEPVRIREIADAHGIPSRFLVQILLQLKGAGIVQSTRGASGGYQLAKDPADVTLGEVMSAVDGQTGQITSNTGTPTPATRVLLAAWKRISAAEREMLAEVTFADLAGSLKGQLEGMYYI
jgi:Rrf2 family protein